MNINFEKINSKKIFNIFTEPKISKKKVIIMNHGFRSSSIGPARTFVNFEKLLLKNGFSVFRFDQPNSGNSEGDYIDSSFKEWVDTTSYFANKFLEKGFKVCLFGQSMGATTAMVATLKKDLKGNIPCIILWVPGPVSDFNKSTNEIYEEEGQKYKGKFWKEARDSNFFKCLDEYDGAIHLVYGEEDKYISQVLRTKVIEAVKNKKQEVMILKGQNHSPWYFDSCQVVFTKELKFVKKYLL
jgi:hypothetical protein